MPIKIKAILSVTLSIYFLLLSINHSHAQGQSGSLYLYPFPQLEVGDPISIKLTLTTVHDLPLEEQTIDLYLNRVFIQSLVTDANGFAFVSLMYPLNAGKHILEAVYTGYQFNIPNKSIEFEVMPAEVMIQSVPVIAGLELLFDGNLVTTGEDGVARVLVNNIGRYDVQFLPNTEILAAQNAKFVQWFPPSFTDKTYVDIPGVTMVEIGFEKQFSVTFEFFDTDGNQVPANRVEELVLRGSNGDVLELKHFDESVLDVNRIFARLAGLDSANVVYRIHNVIVDGSNVINQGQQRFIYSPDQVIPVELLMYSINVMAEDIIFRTPSGNGIFLQFPDGKSQFYPSNPENRIHISSLARGNYFVRIDSDEAFILDIPLVISRNQDVRIPVISYLDIIFAYGFALLILIGLPIFGHRRKLIAFFHRLGS